MRSSSTPRATTATCRRCSISRVSRRCTRRTRSTRAPTSPSEWVPTTTVFTTCRETRSPPRSKGSLAAAGKFRTLLVVALMAGACSSPQNTATQPSPSVSGSYAASPPAAASPGQENAVPAQVLAPAPDLPVANLCSTQITLTADGNATPLLCKSGAVNVPAWRFYADVSASVLSLGLNPTAGQVEAAICDDLKRSHATRVEEQNAYKLASTYYGWNFNIDPAKVTCQ